LCGFPYLYSTPPLYFVLSSLIHLSLFFIVSFVSFWCLLKSSLSSFICFYVFSCSLFWGLEIS
jgi:hypothetical protein